MAGEGPGRPQTAIQGYVSHLRKTLGPDSIVTGAGGYQLRLAAEAIDIAEFEGPGGNGGEARAARRATKLAEALALWRGPALAEFTYESWAQSAIARLEELRVAALEARLDAELQSGRDAEIVGEIEALVQAHPLRERLRAQLMLALYRAGRQADALEAYSRARATLVEELGIEPSSELQDLHRSVLNQDSTLHIDVVRSHSNLPAAATPLVGRRRELEETAALLNRHDIRLLTIMGPGGSGKTRLALAVAEDAASSFADGVYLCALAAITDPRVALATIGYVVDATDHTSGSPLAALEDALRDRELLLVLDNLEQVLDVAPPLRELLARCRGLKILATSRVSLRLTGEHEYAIGPLEESDATALFKQRARAVRPGFRSNGDVNEICNRLDRLPLAIELAASRANALSAAQILERLQQRLPLLTGGPRDAPARQQTLRSAIAWSYDLLAPAEQQLFARLGVFAGGFTLEAAEGVCESDLDDLATLVDSSLVGFADERYTMLETIAEYARDRLADSGDEESVRMRHSEWYREFAEHNVSPLLEGGDQDAATRRFAAEQTNVAVALAFAREAGQAELALRLAEAVGLYWYHTSTYVTYGLEQLEATLAVFDGPAGRWARTALCAGWLAFDCGRLDRASDYAQRALALRDEVASVRLVGETLNLLGAIATEQDPSGAEARYTEALKLASKAGDRQLEVTARNNLGILAAAGGDSPLARMHLKRALDIVRELEDDHHAAMLAANLGLVEVIDASAVQASRHFVEALDRSEAVRAGAATVTACVGIALGLAQTGAYVPAARVLGLVEAMLQRTGLVLQILESDAFQQTLSICGSALQDRLRVELDWGRELPSDRVASVTREAAERLAAGAADGRPPDANLAPTVNAS